MNDDEATQAPLQDIRAAPDSQTTGPAGHDTARLGGTVVAGPPDDAHHFAMLEIAAALNGEPPPGL